MEFVRREFEQDGNRIIDFSARGRTIYLAWEQAGQVRAVVVLLFRSKGDWGYRCYTEDEGPYHFDCPQRLLDRLSPPQSEYATQWRQQCRRRRLELQAQEPLKEGDWIKLSEPVRFRDGDEQDTFELRFYRSRRRRQRYYRSAEGLAYRFKLGDRKYERIASPLKGRSREPV